MLEGDSAVDGRAGEEDQGAAAQLKYEQCGWPKSHKESTGLKGARERYLGFLGKECSRRREYPVQWP